MTTDNYPSIDLIHANEPAGSAVGKSRWKVFFLVFVVTAILGLSFVYLRPAIYQASVSIVVSMPKDIDRASDIADVENVAIQRRVLLGQEILTNLSNRLNGDGIIQSPTELKLNLDVYPEPETNLIELSCTGEDPQSVQKITNTWADIYDEFRRAQLTEVMESTTQRIKEEQADLEKEINKTRQTLSDFRTKHNIVSDNREDNKSSSALRGLNRSLNSARESMLAAKSKVLAIEKAIERGEIVVPKEQRSSITQMQTEADSLRSQLVEARKNFTEKYIERDPFLAGIPAYLSELESTIEAAATIGRRAVQEEAQRNLETEEQAYTLLEQELSRRNRNIESFTENFKTFQVLEEDLSRKQQLHADGEERLTQIRVSNTKKYPPIQIIERAVVPRTPISPNYERDALLAIISALTFAVFATWLLDYLSGRSAVRNNAPQAFGVRVYSGNDSPRQAQFGPPLTEQIDDDSDKVMLASPRPTSKDDQLPRELAPIEVRLLLDPLQIEDVASVWLLLSGVSPREYSLLIEENRASAVDASSKSLSIPGLGQRQMEFSETGWHRIMPFVDAILTTQLDRLSRLRELDLAILAAAKTSGIDDPITVNALTIWHSYVMYLIRQGTNLTTLEHRVGPIPSAIATDLGLVAGPLESNILNFDYPLE